jgi:hypothetical protein
VVRQPGHDRLQEAVGGVGDRLPEREREHPEGPGHQQRWEDADDEEVLRAYGERGCDADQHERDVEQQRDVAGQREVDEHDEEHQQPGCVGDQATGPSALFPERSAVRRLCAHTSTVGRRDGR